MESLTCYQANRTIEVMLVRWKPAGQAGTKSLTSFYSANRTRVWVMTVWREPAGPGMESLTYYQANRTIEVMSVRWKLAGPAMKSLTYYQANRTSVEVMSVRRASWTWYGITHLLSSQQNHRSDVSEMKASWIGWHKITHFLLSSQ